MRLAPFAAMLFAVSTLSAPLQAQDQDYFGAAVTFAGRDLLVVKRAPARGPAAVFAYRPSGGAWLPVGELRAPDALERGLALSPSIAATGDLMVVGAGDPADQFGAHLFARQGANWEPAGDITLNRPTGGDVEVSMATVMAILQPVPRGVAMADDRIAVSFRDRVRLFARTLTGTWAERPTPAVTPYPGSAPVLVDDRIAVGTASGGGGVHLIPAGRDGAGITEVLRMQGAEEADRFGSVLATDGKVLAVGAPGANTVVLYHRLATGEWTQSLAMTRSDLAGFGSALAISGNMLLVGAPGARQVVRYKQTGNMWDQAARYPADASAGPGYGTTLAIGPDGYAIGDPTAAGGRGRVWVHPRDASSQAAPAALGPADAPETMVSGEVKCEDGKAGAFDCHDVDLSAFLTIESLGGSTGERVSDLWGWTDPVTGREYGLVGRSGALVFVDLTEATAPRVVGEMPAPLSGARDIKVYKDHAFMTGDGAGAHGLMIFDLARLRRVGSAKETFAPDAIYRGIASAHNLVIDTTAGLAIPVAATAGGNTCGGGLHIVDIRVPVAPVFLGCYTDTEGLVAPGRTHDAQCVTYQGPDATYRGHQICFALNETALRVVDISDPESPVPLSAARYPGQAYIHQGWLTEDSRYFYMNDELDELVGTTDRTRTTIWDVSDLDDPIMVGQYLGADRGTDHNLYVKGDRMYQANYQSGLAVVDIRDPLNPKPLGSFDTTPYAGNSAGFYGAWTAFPYFESGQVIVSSMQEGLFILKPRPATVVP